jgi:hypothetical protein
MTKMGFNNSKNKSVKEMIINKDFTNGIIFGRTGSGKTTCAILPNIEDRIKSDYGLLIYDFKGNLHLQTKYIANKYNKLSDVIEIGKPWGKRINLCDYLSLKQISMIVKTDENKSNYWDVASRNLLEMIFVINKKFNTLENEFKRIDKEFALLYEVKQTSYESIYNQISLVEETKNFFDTMSLNLEYVKEKLNTDEISSYKNRLNILHDCINSISKSLNSLKIYKSVNKDDDHGKNAVVNHLNSILNQIASKEYLNVNDIDIIKELRAGKIVIIDVSTFSENILDSINIAIYTRLQQAKYEIMKPVSIVIDEAQKVLSAEYLPQTDVCRESKFEYIFATQEQILLINKLGNSKFEELYSNLIDKYSFSTNNIDTMEQFEYLNISNNRKYFANPLFIDRKELIKVEHEFLKLNNLLELADYQSNEPYIFIYDSKLIEDYKIMIETMDEKYITVDYFYSTCETQTIEIKSKDKISIKINPNTYSSRLNDMETNVNNCLRFVGGFIKTEKRLEDRITILENRFDLLTPELKYDETF